MKAYEDAEAADMEQMSVADEEAAQGGGQQVRQGQVPNVSSWRYFWAGQSLLGRENGIGAIRRSEAERVGEGNGNGSGRKWWQVWKRRGGEQGGLAR